MRVLTTVCALFTTCACLTSGSAQAQQKRRVTPIALQNIQVSCANKAGEIQRAIIKFKVPGTDEKGEIELSHLIKRNTISTSYKVNGYPLFSNVSSPTSAQTTMTAEARKRVSKENVQAFFAYQSALADQNISAQFSQCFRAELPPGTLASFGCGIAAKLARAGCWAAGAVMCVAGGIETALASCALGGAFASFCSDAATDAEQACNAS